MTPLAAAGALVVLLNILSPLHRPLRKLCRGRLQQQVQQQLGVVAWAQQWTHPVMDWAVIISAATVTLEFYLTFIPVLIWFGYAQQMAVVLALMAMQGQAVFGLKDLFESPRPADCLKAAPSNTHITIRDYSGDVEDGFPSAHCSGSVVLLFYSITAATQAGWISAAWSLPLQVAAAAWVAWIAFGRLYLAVHSPVDLAAGCALGACILALWQQHLHQPYCSWLEQSPHLPLHVALISFVVMRCFPMASRHTAPYSYCTAWLAGWAGVVLGYRIMHRVHGEVLAGAAAALQTSRLFAAWPLWQAACIMTAKVVVGLMLAAVTKAVVKACMLLVLQQVFSLVPLPIRCLWQPPIVGTVKCYGGSGCVSDVPRPVEQRNQQQAADPKRLSAEQQLVELDSTAGTDQNCKAPLHHATVPAEMSPSSMWVLRYAPNGMANDVVATARFVSYAALGWVVVTIDAWWQPLVSNFLYSTSTA